MGNSFILDFGEHFTGQFIFTLRRFGIPVDAPVRLSLIFGEVPAEVAEKLGRHDDVRFIPEIIRRMEDAARQQLWDDSQGLFVSGPGREVSYAGQAWMVLAQTPTKEQARRAMLSVMRHPEAVKPVTPYLHHYVVEAPFAAGLPDEANRLMRSYWGDMIRKVADTFWEVFVPGDDFASPYKSHLMNSYCHAWSCTPAYLLRRAGE